MKTRKTFYLIGKIKDDMNEFVTSELESRGIKGIVLSHGAILMALYKASSPMTMKEIAEKINRTQPTVTVLVNKLGKLGYIRKVKSNTDGRSTNVELTQKGVDFKKIFLEITEKLNERLHKNLSDIEEEMLERILEKIIED